MVLTLCRLVLGNPRVQFCDSVVKEHPFLDKDISLSLSMSRHLLCCCLGSCKYFQVVDTVLVKSKNLVIQSFHFCKIRRFRETFTSSLFSTGQPGAEFLDTSSVLSPELDIIGVFVTFNLCL